MTDRFDLATDLYTVRFDTDRDNLKGFSLLYFENGDIDWHKDHLNDEVPTSPAGIARTDWLNFGFRNFYDWNAWRGLWLSGGFDISDENGWTENLRAPDDATIFEANGRLTTTSPYAGARYDFALDDDWTLTPSAGARYYFHSTYDGEWAPNAALTLDYQEMVQVFVNGSRGIHYPGVYTRAVSDDFAKGTLDAEKMDYFSFGTKLTPREEFDILASVFHTDVRNRIDKTANGYLNAGGMSATGIETAARWHPNDDLAFFGGVTYTNPETTPVSRMPRWTVNAGVTWKVCEYLKWTVDGSHIDRMYAYSVRNSVVEDGDLRSVGDALILNTRLALPLESVSAFKGEVYVALENLTDRRYEYYPGYPMGGIMWYLGCRFRF